MPNLSIINKEKEIREKLVKLTTDDGGEIGNFTNVKNIIKSIHERSSDFVTERRFLDFSSEGFNLFLNNSNINSKFLVSNWCLSQICTLIDVPARYIKKCLLTEPDLAVINMNNWFAKLKGEKSYILRTTDNKTVHGFLTQRYSIFDDIDVTNVIEESLSQKAEYILTDYTVSPEIMNLRIVKREKIQTLDDNDLSIGFNIKNSRVGRSSIEIEFIVYKWICSNGLVIQGGKGLYFSKKHIGNSFEFKKSFEDIILKVPDVINLVSKQIEKAKSRDLSNEKMLEMLKEADKIMAESTHGEILNLVPKYGNNLRGLTNAITEKAQDYSLELRERMERYAGHLLAAA